VLVKRLGILTVVRVLDVMEFGGIRDRTLRCTELAGLQWSVECARCVLAAVCMKTEGLDVVLCDE